MSDSNSNFDQHRKGTRTRNWATVVYPESAPKNWREILGEMRVPCFLSPLHDKDINPDGTPKKAHYHVLFAFDAVKNREQFSDFIKNIGGVGAEKVASLRGYARYLCHLDNPEKHQYDTEAVQCLGGTDYQSVIGLPTDKYKAIDEMIEFCEEENIFSFAILINYSRINRRDWFRVLCDNGAVVIEKYLKSRFWTLQSDKKRG